MIMLSDYHKERKILMILSIKQGRIVYILLMNLRIPSISRDALSPGGTIHVIYDNDRDIARMPRQDSEQNNEAE